MKTATTELICQRLLESRLLLNGVALLGVGAVAFAAAGCWAARLRVDGLCEAVDSLNEEIARFLEAGGCLDGIRGVQAIIEALKDGGADVDARLVASIQSAERAATEEPRAVWDPRVQRLAMRIDGEAGAREFNFCLGADKRLAA